MKTPVGKEEVSARKEQIQVSLHPEEDSSSEGSQFDDSSSSDNAEGSQQEIAAAAADDEDDTQSAEHNSNELVCYFGGGSERRPLGLAWWSPARRRVWKVEEPADTCTSPSAFAPCFQARSKTNEPLESSTLSHSVLNFFLRVPQEEELLYKTNPVLAYHHTWHELKDMGWGLPTGLDKRGAGQNGAGLSDVQNLQLLANKAAFAKASSEPAPPKRKRGRPPKAQGEAMQEAAPIIKKKKLGRPPKVQNAALQAAAPAKKKRSRPPKNRKAQGKSLAGILDDMEKFVVDQRAHLHTEQSLKDKLAAEVAEHAKTRKALKKAQTALRREEELRKSEKDTMEAYLKQQVQQSMEEAVNQKVQEAMKSVFKSQRPV